MSYSWGPYFRVYPDLGGGGGQKGRGPGFVFPVFVSKMDPITAHIQSKARGRLDKGWRSYFQRHPLGEGGGGRERITSLLDPIAGAILAELGRDDRGAGGVHP